MLKMDSVRKQRDTNSLRVAGVKAAGQTPISIILNMGSISCSPESTEDECNGIVQGDSTLVKQYLEDNDCLETGQGDVGGEENLLLKMRGNCSISNYQEMLKGKDKIEGKVWEGYSVHGNENVLTVDQKVVKLHVGLPTTDQTPSHDKRPATCMIQSSDEHDERPTANVAQDEERSTANVAQSEERATANVTQSEERPTANVAQSEERPTANVTQSEERPTADVAQSEERPTANVAQSEERPTANVTQSEERPTANVTQSEERATANVTQSEERQTANVTQSDERATANVTQSEERPTANVAQSEERPTANVTQSEERLTADVAQSEEHPTGNVAQSEERPTANVAQSEECPTANVTQSEERPTANAAQSEERPTANVTQSEERPTANVTQSEERATANVAQSEERPTANVTQSEERPTANVAQSEERPTANVAQSDERPTANVTQSDERQATDLALSLDEEVKIDVKTQRTKNKFQLTMKENVKILPDPMTSPERIVDVALGRKSTSRISPKSNRLAKLLLAFSLVISMSSSVAATHLIPPGQKLPGKCFDLLETDGNDCPQYDDPFFESRYTSLNETCCAGYPYLDFHCQMDYQKSGEQFSMIACLRTVEVPKNHSGRMMGYDTSDPYFKVEKLDEAQAKEPTRESWQVTNSYHPHAKIRCEGLGQQLLCLGVEDNLCTCQVGFNTSGKGCKSGFGAEDACVCQHLDCNVGYHAARNFSKQIGGSCGDLVPGFTAEFICEKNPIPASTISSTTQSTFAGSSTTSHPPNTTRAGGDDDGKKDSKTTMIITLVVVFLLIVLILVVLVIKYWAKLKAKLSSHCSCGNVIVNCLKSYGQCSDGSSEPVDGSPRSVFLASASSESVV